MENAKVYLTKTASVLTWLFFQIKPKRMEDRFMGSDMPSAGRLIFGPWADSDPSQPGLSCII